MITRIHTKLNEVTRTLTKSFNYIYKMNGSIILILRDNDSILSSSYIIKCVNESNLNKKKNKITLNLIISSLHQIINLQKKNK